MFWLAEDEYESLCELQEEWGLNRQQAITLAVRLMARLATIHNPCNTGNETYLIRRGGVYDTKDDSSMVSIIQQELTAMGLCNTVVEKRQKTRVEKTPIKQGPKSQTRRASPPTDAEIRAFWKRKARGE